jgi:hypothetical protein
MSYDTALLASFPRKRESSSHITIAIIRGYKPLLLHSMLL